MKILVVSSSPRKGGCSEGLAQAFIRGAESAGNEICHYSLAGNKNVNGCRACRYCYTHDGVCVQQDDIAPIIDAMRDCEMLVLATPTYYYSLPAQAKAVFDRMYSRHGKPLHIKKSALLVTLEDAEDTTDILQAQYQTVVRYMGWKDMGVVCAGGMFGAAIPADHPALRKAEELGKSIR